MYYGWSAVAGMRVCQLQLSLCRSKFRLKTDNETVVLLRHEINQHIQMLLNGKYVKKNDLTINLEKIIQVLL